MVAAMACSKAGITGPAAEQGPQIGALAVAQAGLEQAGAGHPRRLQLAQNAWLTASIQPMRPSSRALAS